MVCGVSVQPGLQIVGFDRHRRVIALGPDPARLADRPVERGDLVEHGAQSRLVEGSS
jgi:hypothetical protein